MANPRPLCPPGETENLWLNLSTGYIGGGRRNWDGTGGSGAALQHFLDTGSRYPLCVKLGEHCVAISFQSLAFLPMILTVILILILTLIIILILVLSVASVLLYRG